ASIGHAALDRRPIDAFVLEGPRALIAHEHAMAARGERFGKCQEGPFGAAKRRSPRCLAVKDNAVIGHHDDAHQAALPGIRVQRLRAAASAASTVRLSISVSVVKRLKSGGIRSRYGIAVETVAVCAPHGAYCSTGLGPKSPKVGVPAAAAKCMSPVSLPMK